MRETDFIDQNKEKWAEFEQSFKNKNDPDRLSELFIEITDDLSYARTFYPNRSVRVYLNLLAQRVFNSLYKTKKSGWSAFKYFWREELPQIVWFARRELLFALGLFVLAFIIGAFSSAQDPDFLRSILGERYVTMTEENIESGDPLAVYKQAHEAPMFLGIALNNLQVAFLAFMLGLSLGIGTMGLILFNGVMVGCFQYFFIQKGLFRESFFTVWLHGTLEISCIVMGAGAGFLLARSLMFPGTYSRLQSFIIGARRAFKLMLAIMPIIVLAAFIEGYLTRHTEASDWLRGALIFASLTFIIGYFVVYPWLKMRSGWEKPLEEEKPPALPDSAIDYHAVKSIGELFKDLFQPYRQNFRRLFWPGAVISLGIAFITAVWGGEEIVNELWLTKGAFLFEGVVNFFTFLDFATYPYLFPCFIVLVTVLLTLSGHALMTAYHQSTDGIAMKYEFKDWLRTAFNAAVIAGVLMLHGFIGSWGIVIAMITLPFLLTLYGVATIKGKDIFSGLGDLKLVMPRSRANQYPLAIVIILLLLSFLILTGSAISYLLFDYIIANFDIGFFIKFRILAAFFIFFSGLGITLFLPMLHFALGLFCFSQIEINTAAGLLRKIESMGQSKRIYGLERE